LLPVAPTLRSGKLDRPVKYRFFRRSNFLAIRVHAERMRTGIGFAVTTEDRLRLEAIVGDRNAKQKHVKRAKVILATADGCGTNEIMRRSELCKPMVWRWQERFMHEGVDGLLRDKTREPGKKPLPKETVQRVIDLALGPPPGEVTHWTGRMLAKAAGVSLRSVQRIL
jgi:transposase